ncbi:MAG: hypothetical protein ACQEWV_26490 [Bacillota bacterium]
MSKGDPTGARAEEAPGPPAESECLQRKSTAKFNRAKIKEYKDLYELGNATFLQRKEMLMQHKLEVQNKIDESLKLMEVITYKIAMYELQEEEVRKNANYNFKCHLFGD